jgi:hypothetical protein
MDPLNRKRLFCAKRIYFQAHPADRSVTLRIIIAGDKVSTCPAARTLNLAEQILSIRSTCSMGFCMISPQSHSDSIAARRQDLVMHVGWVERSETQNPKLNGYELESVNT